MLCYFNIVLLDVTFFLMLHYFKSPLVLAALFNVALLQFCTSSRCIILLLHYCFNIVLFSVTLDDCCTFSTFSLNIALLMSQCVLTITSSCANDYFLNFWHCTIALV